MAGGGGGEVNKEEMISIQDQRGEGHAAVANSNSAHMVHVRWQHEGRGLYILCTCCTDEPEQGGLWESD